MAGLLRRASVKGINARTGLKYLITYGWALLFIVASYALIYVYAIAPSLAAPTLCSFNYGASCNEAILGSNSVGTTVVMLISNSQPRPIANPSMLVNLAGKGNVTASCMPDYVLPGSSMSCSVSVPIAYGQGTYLVSQLYLLEQLCDSGPAVSSCRGPLQQLQGNMDTHVQQMASTNPVSISLRAENNTAGADGTPDRLAAAVAILGYPYRGASVAYSDNQSFPISPSVTDTDINGVSTSYISSTSPGNALVHVNFSGYSASTSINFIKTIAITFVVANTSNVIGPALVVDGVSYDVSELPVTVNTIPRSNHTYGFSSVVGSGAEKLALVSVSGCGVSGATGIIRVSSNCTATATYKDIGSASP